MTKKRVSSSYKRSRTGKACLATKRWALVGGSFVAIHCWPEAPESERYLRSQHRHMFEVRIQIEVFHADREIEYYNFKKQLQIFLMLMPKYLTSSCEMYCDIIATMIKAKYPKRDLVVKVLEDGMEGAVCEYAL